MWHWIYKFGSPKWFYELTTAAVFWLAIGSAVLFGVGLIWALGFAPPDYQMGDNYRIIYIHVPAAGLMKGCYYLMALMSFGYLMWNIKMADIVAQACVPIGATVTLLMLVTGSLWGKPTWGVFWIWDARLTSSLLMLFIYLGIMSLRSAYDSKETAAKVCAILCLVGLVNLPIIQYSVDWWNTLHQPASNLSLRDTSANPPEIWIPAFIMGFGMITFFFLSLLIRVRTEIIIRERRSSWVKELFSGARS